MSKRKNLIIASGAAAAAAGAKILIDKKTKKTSEQDNEVTFTKLAKALADDFVSVYYIDLTDNSYVEFGTQGEGEKLSVLSEGDDFFEDTPVNAAVMVYEPDRERFIAAMRKDNLLSALESSNAYTLGYRLVIDDEPQYFNLKVTRADSEHIVVGVRNVDVQMRHEAEENKRSETYSMIATALASRYEVIYYVDTVTDEFTEYTASKAYAKLKVGNHGNDFFGLTQENMKRDIYPADYPMMAKEMQKERLLSELDRDETYSITYRLMLEGKPIYVNLRAIRPSSNDRYIIIGVSNIDSSKKRELEFQAALGSAMNLATRDDLTGVKNKRAYSQLEAEINDQIIRGTSVPFAVIICDMNGLKIINDTQGHHMGDKCLKDACAAVCRKFQHSPVFRVGGDEFAAVLRGEDYENRKNLVRSFRASMTRNKSEGKVTVACGIADFEPSHDGELADVFNRADIDMYANKKKLKR